MDCKNQSKTIVNLECGTSLAELEFASEIQQAERKSKEKKDEECSQSAVASSSTTTTCEEMIRSIRNNLSSNIVMNGNIQMFTSPYETPEAQKAMGQTSIPEKQRYVSVPLVYCDQTASNRPMKSVEKYIQDVCLPLYGNTHTNTSVTGSQSTAFVAEARQIIAEGCNAKITGKAALDVVLFAGNGTTSVVELLIDCIGIKHYASDETTRPIVFVGPYEHHSNLLPWRESGCKIVMIPESAKTGNVDLDYLQLMLVASECEGRLLIGAFTAASNVTGKVCDVDKISAILHKHGALSFFDYATAAAYLPMDMNPFPTENFTAADVSKDAIFISPHKMVGGVQTPGILVVKKHLINQINAPKRSGGGTVFYVTHKHHRFLSNRIERFEGGTPNVAGIMRAGLTFLVKRRIAEQYLQAVERGEKEDNSIIPRTLLNYEFDTYKRVVERLKKTSPNIIVLGAANEDTNDHLPIFSFLVKCGDRFLHYNYVCAILNDLFGIQSRGGCQCAGPYSQRLLGLTKAEGLEEVPNEVNDRIEHALLKNKERAELLRPGFTRLSLPFKGLHHDEVEYVIKALEWVAKNGWVFMSQYRCNHRSGEWRHFSRQGKPLGRSERRWLSHFDLNYYASQHEDINNQNCDPIKVILGKAFDNANYQLSLSRNDHTIAQALKMTDKNEMLDNDDLDLLRWYVYPRECAILLKKGEEPDNALNNVSGGIRPMGYFEPEVFKFTSSLPAIIDDENYVVESAIEETLAKDDIEDNTEVHFRDGEDHSGRARVIDIIAGYEDGELSDQCLLYIENEDEWIPVIEVLTRRKAQPFSPVKAKDSDDMQVDSTIHPPDVDMKPVSTIPKEPKDSSREKKKPSRDSSSWGKIDSVQVTLPKPIPREAVSKSDKAQKQPTKKNGKNHPDPQDTCNKRKKTKHIKPPAKLMRYITQAIMQWDMIQEGDRLLLGLSGGKDSLSLLHCLLEFQRKLPTKFEIEVCTIDPMTPSFDPSPLIPYIESLGLKYHYIRDNIVARANTAGTNGQVVKSLCAFCARMKRGNLYATARKNNCNKLVLAQHLDDCAESFLMSAMHNGFIRSKL